MTGTLRSLSGIVFAALLALSLVATTTDAMGATRSVPGGPNFFDPGNVNSNNYFKPKPIGRFGVTWE